MKILDIVRVKATGRIGYIMCANEDRWDVQFPTEYKVHNHYKYYNDILDNQEQYRSDELVVVIPA